MKTSSAINELKDVIDIIRHDANTSRIILFGSRARGDYQPDSDYDIMVLTKDAPHERDITRKIYRDLIKHNIYLGVELFSMSEAKWKRAKAHKSYFYQDVDKEGIVIYHE